MGTLFSTLSIARSDLATAQVQLDIAGHNIANANKEGFSRQRVELIGLAPINQIYGQICTGVGNRSIERIRDEFLDGLYQDQVAGLGNAEIRAEFFELIESVFLEPSDSGLSTRINRFFSSLNEFATNVESIPVRTSVLTEAAALAQALNDTSSRLRTLRTNANQEVINLCLRSILLRIESPGRTRVFRVRNWVGQRRMICGMIGVCCWISWPGL